MQPTQLRIVAAAERRFADYGFCKTTMAEIAADCGMSVGNLYRHFENKSAIAAASMQLFLDHKLAAGLAAAADKQSAPDKLAAFLVTRLHISHARVVDARHLHELVQAIDDHHAQLLLAQEQKVIEAMAAILQTGMDAGEIRPGDAGRIAYLIHQSVLRYNHPISLKRNPLAKLEGDLRDYLEILFTGLCPNRLPDSERQRRSDSNGR